MVQRSNPVNLTFYNNKNLVTIASKPEYFFNRQICTFCLLDHRQQSGTEHATTRQKELAAKLLALQGEGKPFLKQVTFSIDGIDIEKNGKYSWETVGPLIKKTFTTFDTSLEFRISEWNM